MSFAPRIPFEWRLRSRSLALGRRTLLMGILNVTPDSFSDGGLHATVDSAVAHGLAMLDEGADLLDLGGESTRPHATPLSPEEEQARVLPVIAAILEERRDAILSIDTYHATTARAAIEAGAEIVNDVSGLLWDPAMAALCGEFGCGLILTHTRGRPPEWASQPPLASSEVMPTVLAGLERSICAARAAGVPNDRLVVDPGFGFGKRGGENLVIHAGLDQLRRFGVPLMTGTSRKGFLRAPLSLLHFGVAPSTASDASVNASMASAVACILAGAHLLRVHDVRRARETAMIADAILEAHAGEADILHTNTGAHAR